MDKEQAKFILSSYRPGGIDVDDHDFAEALALAADNRELGEWLAHERAMDEAFAKALGSIQLPDGLREDIIGCLEGERHGFPEASDPQDTAMIGALAAVHIPNNLRGDILAAMQRSSPETGKPQVPSPAATPKKASFWKRFSIPLAAAAGVAFALILTQPGKKSQLASNGLVPISSVPVSFIKTFESPSFSLELQKENKDLLIDNLKSRSLPCPCSLPPGLQRLKGLGCRELTINGHKGSLICFHQNAIGIVHLVIFRREDVNGSCMGNLKHPCYIPEGKWSVARWQNDDNVFFLIGKTNVAEMKKIF